MAFVNGELQAQFMARSNVEVRLRLLLTLHRRPQRRHVLSLVFEVQGRARQTVRRPHLGPPILGREVRSGRVCRGHWPPEEFAVEGGKLAWIRGRNGYGRHPQPRSQHDETVSAVLLLADVEGVLSLRLPGLSQ